MSTQTMEQVTGKRTQKATTAGKGKSPTVPTVRVKLKPVSSNRIWAGKRFRTPLYNTYETELFYLLPRSYVVPDGPLEVTYRFGFSSKLSDIDNPIKPLTDILQKFYNFNDKQIFKMTVEKELVTAGEEFIEFTIKKMV